MKGEDWAVSVWRSAREAEVLAAGSSVGLGAGVTPRGLVWVRRGGGGHQHTLGAPGWMEVMQAGSTRGLGRRADSSIRLCHWRGSPVNFCSCWSKPVCTRCSKLDGAEISTRFFFFPNMAPGSQRGEGADLGSCRQACGRGRLARTCYFSSILWPRPGPIHPPLLPGLPTPPSPLPSLSPTCSPRDPVNTRVRPLAQSPPVAPPHSGEKLSPLVARPTRPAPSLLCSHLYLSLTRASEPQGLALAVPSVGNTLPQYPHTWSPPSLPSGVRVVGDSFPEHPKKKSPHSPLSFHHIS